MGLGAMSDIERLELLTRQMHLEPAEEIGGVNLSPRTREAITVKTAQMPNGKRIRLLKTLLSSYCERNCTYCPFRSGRDMPRAAFTPDDFARLFDSLYRAGYVEGIFLSSSIFQGNVTTQDKLLATASLLRDRYHFQGYLHLKIMPGAERDQIWEAMLLADRLSINLEAPHPRALSSLAPEKDFNRDLLEPLRWIEEIRTTQAPHRAWKQSWPSSTTQFVVGAAGESDLDILSATAHLRQTAQIARAYYSSFNPFPNTPLENIPPSPPRREQRLYQAFYLLQEYGFSLEDLIYQENGNLPLDRDPKLAWANIHLLHRPLEINIASREQLLRVPGLGPQGTKAILFARRQKTLTNLNQLKTLGIQAQKAKPYILLNGKAPARQIPLF
jgi:predicted DNA-binding helix-hairpin-helix protein